MSEDKASIHQQELMKEAASAVRALVYKIKARPQRYTDNVGANFILELHGKENGLEKVAGFLIRLDNVDNRFKLELNEEEKLCLDAAGEKTGIVSQILGARISSNLKATLTSRRAVLVIGGATVGGYLVGRLSKMLSEKVVGVDQEEVDRVSREYKELSSKPGIEELKSKGIEYLTQEEMTELLEHHRSAEGLVDQQAEVSMNLLKKLTGNITTITTPIGTLFGMSTVLSDEITHQASKKLEDVIQEVDKFCNFKLGRTQESAIAR